MTAEIVAEVEISTEMLKSAKRIKEERLTMNMAKQYDLIQQEQQLRVDIKNIENWLYERK